MAEKKKRMISIRFTGKELFNNTIFDTTEESVAKENKIFDQNKKYSPLTIITGEKEMLPIVEKEIEEMKEGEERTIKLLAKDAFGERKNNLIRVVPLKNFVEQKINPFPGLIVRIGNAFGKVQSVGSGRVRIDFNHPLAGRDVEYKVKLEKEFVDKKEISEQLYSKYYERIPGTKKEISEDTLTITLEGEAFKNLAKINEVIKKLALELGVKLEIKEGEKIIGKKDDAKETTKNKKEDLQHIHEHNPEQEKHIHP